MLDIPLLRSIIPGADSMKANTALGLMLTASAILFDGDRPKLLRQMVPVCGTLLVLLSLATLLEDVTGGNFGIDEFLFVDRTPPILVTAAGRMAVVTAITFLLLGCAILVRNRVRGLQWDQFLAAGAGFLCLANLVGYLYGIDNFVGIEFYTGMAVHTSSGLLILSLSMLFSRPDRGLMELVTSEYLGGVLARRLLPAALMAPVLLGWLAWRGERNALYGGAFGIALFATSNVVVFAYLTWTAGRRLNSLDVEKAKAAARLQASEDLMSIFVKRVPAAVAMLDRDLRYLQVSDRWCTDYRLNRSELLGRSHNDVFPDLPERWRSILRRCLDGETLREEEDRWERADRGSIWLRWEVRPWGEWNGVPEGILILAEDITERKHAEDALRESEATIRTLLETAAQAILAVDGKGDIILANRMAGEMFGYTRDELIGRPLERLLPGRLKSSHAAHRATFMSNLRSRPMGMGLELEGLRKDGSDFPVEVSLSSLQSSSGPLAVSFVSDITARKQAEAALRDSEQQLRALAGSLITAQDDERRRLSRELHDDITQQLAFVSIELGKLTAQKTYALEETRARIRALQDQTLRMSNEVRRLSHGLHPSVIEDFGLSIALEEFCDEYARIHDISVRFEGLVEDSQLSREGATCLYRLVQESLRNAVVHGRATEIYVELTTDPESIHLRVRDNGAGFETDCGRSKAGLGIISMKERIRLVHGTLELSSRPGQGTEITASVPLTGGVH